MHGNSKKTILAKTFKIVLPSRRDANFQEIEDRKKEKSRAENMKKSHLCGDVVLGGILDGFWEVSGGRKSRVSHFFRCFFEVIFEARSGRAKNRPKRPNKTQMVDFGAWFPVVPTLLGREKERGSRAWACIKSLAFQIRHL